nr:hypothetical protein [Tanacetum cinerariifolium]
MADLLHNWYDKTTTKEKINDSPNNVDAIQESFKEAHPTRECPFKKEDKVVEQSKYMRSLEKTIIKFCDESIKKQAADDEWIREFIKNMKSNIMEIKTTTRNLEETAYQLTQTVLTNTREKFKARTTMGKENMKDPVPCDLPPTLFLGHLKEQIGSPYKTRETICMIENPREVHKLMAQEDEGDVDVGWDITVDDVERLRQFLTPAIHTLRNIEPIVQPYMSLGSVHNKKKIIREEEQDYNILKHYGLMQPLTPQTVHITPPDDDYVASATSPTLVKKLNEFKKECSDITRVTKKVDGNPVKDIKELIDTIKKFDFETFIRKLLHKVPRARRQISRPAQPEVLSLGFGSIAGGSDHVDPVVRQLIEHRIGRGFFALVSILICNPNSLRLASLVVTVFFNSLSFFAVGRHYGYGGIMEKGFLDSGNKKKKGGDLKEADKEKKDGDSFLSNDENPILEGIAKHIKNIDGKISVPKSILKKAARTVVGDTHEAAKVVKDEGSASKVSFEAGTKLRSPMAVNMSSTIGCSLASLLNPNNTSNKVHFRTLVNNERVEAVDCVLPKDAAAKVKCRYENSIVGFFLGKDPSFLVVQQISFGRALIEIDAVVGLKREAIMAIPDEEGDGYIKEVVRVEYEWKPPHCVDCVLNPASNPFDVLNVDGVDMGESETQPKPSGVEKWDVINEDDTTDDEDVFTSYGGSVGGDNQLEDEEFDFYGSYADQVVDLDDALKEFRDFKLRMSEFVEFNHLLHIEEDVFKCEIKATIDTKKLYIDVRRFPMRKDLGPMKLI